MRFISTLYHTEGKKAIYFPKKRRKIRSFFVKNSQKGIAIEKKVCYNENINRLENAGPYAVQSNSTRRYRHG